MQAVSEVARVLERGRLTSQEHPLCAGPSEKPSGVLFPGGYTEAQRTSAMCLGPEMSPFHRPVNRGSEKLLHVPEATQPARGSPGTRTQSFLTRLGTVGWREPAVEALSSANQTPLGRDGGSGSTGTHSAKPQMTSVGMETACGWLGFFRRKNGGGNT